MQFLQNQILIFCSKFLFCFPTSSTKKKKKSWKKTAIFFLGLNEIISDCSVAKYCSVANSSDFFSLSPGTTNRVGVPSCKCCSWWNSLQVCESGAEEVLKVQKEQSRPWYKTDLDVEVQNNHLVVKLADISVWMFAVGAKVQNYSIDFGSW